MHTWHCNDKLCNLAYFSTVRIPIFKKLMTNAPLAVSNKTYLNNSNYILEIFVCNTGISGNEIQSSS